MMDEAGGARFETAVDAAVDAAVDPQDRAPPVAAPVAATYTIEAVAGAEASSSGASSSNTEAAVVFEEELVAMESCEAHVTSLITLATAKVKQVWKKFV